MKKRKVFGFILLFIFVGAFLFIRSIVYYLDVHAPSVPSPVPPLSNRLVSGSISHVFIIMMENHGYNDIVGNAQAPYINSLISRYALAANYHAVAHPSLPNYISLTSGNTFGISSDCTLCYIHDESIADQLEQNHLTWKAYMESMPSNCFIGSTDLYAQKHDPFIYYDSIRENEQRCSEHIVPLTQLQEDIASNSIANFTWITPNICDDMHNCSVAVGDTWLSQEIPQILNSPEFQGSGLLFITWDEDDTVFDNNHVATIIISPFVKRHFVSNKGENHYSLLRTIEDIFSLSPLQNATKASPMSEYFSIAL